MDFHQLIRNTKTISKGRVQYPIKLGHVYLYKMVPYYSRKELLFWFKVKSFTYAGVVYDVALKFNNMNLSQKTPLAFHNVFVKPSFYFDPIKDRVDVKVRCNCPDYFFTFNEFNSKNGAHLGKRLTKRTIHPKFRHLPKGNYNWNKPDRPRNPRKLPGMCKHLYNCILYLKRVGYLRVRV